jgi:uncharacterized oligopeptide transporter (OPT) family protein
MGPEISVHMFLGAVFGWAILSPYAKYRGWVSGPADDWVDGARGWTIWVALALLFADASVKLLWFLFRPLINHYFGNEHLQRLWSEFQWKKLLHIGQRSSHSGYIRLTSGVPDDLVSSTEDQMQAANRSPRTLDSVKIAEYDKKHTSEDSAAISKLLVLSFVVTVLVCIFAVHIVFGDIIPWYSTLLAIGLALPMAVVGIRALAETDYNPESALSMC